MRRLFGLFREALRATAAAKMRTLMSALCIGLGVAGVTIITALGSAAIDKANELMDMFGSNSLMITSGDQKKRAVGMRSMTLTISDLEGLQRNFPDAYSITPLRMRGIMVANGNAKLQSSLQSVVSSFNYEWDWAIDKGRDLDSRDNEHSTNVCIIGSYLADKLFTEDEEPIGSQIKLGNSMCEVVGVSVEKSLAANDDDMNNFVVIPDSVFAKKYSWRKDMYRGIRMRFTDMGTADRQVETVREYLRYRHNLSIDDDDDFSIYSASMISGIITAALGAIGAFLGTITLVVVIVGSFVTANMFLLATQTRVNEIGIRRAFGATTSDIFKQFIMEFILITLCGMLVGLGIGWFATKIITSFNFIVVELTPAVFIITALVSMIIALTFGILPAKTAAKIKPIEAIRAL